MLDFNDTSPLAIFLFLIIIGAFVIGYLFQGASTVLPNGELKDMTKDVGGKLMAPLLIILGLVILVAIVMVLLWLGRAAQGAV